MDAERRRVCKGGFERFEPIEAIKDRLATWLAAIRAQLRHDTVYDRIANALR